MESKDLKPGMVVETVTGDLFRLRKLECAENAAVLDCMDIPLWWSETGCGNDRRTVLILERDIAHVLVRREDAEQSRLDAVAKDISS